MLFRRRFLKRLSFTFLVAFLIWYLVSVFGFYNPFEGAKGVIYTSKDKWLRKSHNIVTKKLSLVIPDSVLKSLDSDEWISQSITDLKTKCPVLENGSTNHNLNLKMSCKIPKLNPFHPSMMGLLTNVPMPQCTNQKSYGELVDGQIKFIDNNVVSAKYRRIIRKNDFNYLFGTPATTSNKIMDEFIEVDFLLKNGKHVKEIFMQPVPHEHLMKREGQKKPGIPLNVLIIGVDSLSHANSQRKLPKVYELLKKEFGSVIFNGHSIVGDGTTEQLAAMLTGQGEYEQYESRRHHKNPKPVDGWSWIYKQLKEYGYLTGHAADAPYIGAFQMRLMGFNNSPTDFYPRPFFQIAEKIMKGGDNKCINSKTISRTMFDYIRDVFQVFPEKLKFFFNFNVVYSHKTYSEASMIEPDLFSFLQDFQNKGHLNNTLLIVMGDHGSRYGPARELIQGKLEERLPLFSMTFPSWFSDRYPNIAKNLRTNTDRLTSWYDVYATFRHMLSFPEVPSNIKHGKSLLQEIPLSRTCADATVQQHWCPCLEMSPLNVNHSHVRNAALAAVEYINTLVDEHETSAVYCQILSLKSINYALLERPNDKVLAFKLTRDGGIPGFGAKSMPSHENYCRFQLQFSTSPNNGIYEATVRYYNGWFMVSKGISRVNKYGDQPECIAKDLPHLRKFCLCTRL